MLNPIALRTAKTPLSFGCSECNRVKYKEAIGLNTRTGHPEQSLGSDQTLLQMEHSIIHVCTSILSPL